MQKMPFFFLIFFFFAKALARCLYYMKGTFALLKQILTLFTTLRLQPGEQKYRAGENYFLTGHSCSTTPLRRHSILILSPRSTQLEFRGICPGLDRDPLRTHKFCDPV